MTSEDIDSAMENPDNAEAYMLAVLKGDIDELTQQIDSLTLAHQEALTRLRQDVRQLCNERAKLCLKIHGAHQWNPMGNHPYPDYQCLHCGAVKS